MIKKLILFIGSLGLLGVAIYLYSVSQTQVFSVDELKLGPVESAVQAVIDEQKAVVKSNPKSGAEWGKLGMILQAHSQFDSAIQCYAQANELDSENYKWLYYLADVTAQTDRLASIPILKKALMIEPDNGLIKLRLAEFQLESGDVDSAQKTFFEMANADPENARAQLGMARTLYQENALDAAIDRANKAESLYPGFRSTYDLQAKIYMKKGQRKNAEEKLEALRSLGESATFWSDPLLIALDELRVDAQATADPAHQLMSSGRTTEAIQKFRNLATENPDDLELSIQYVRVLMSAKRFEQAGEFLKEIKNKDAAEIPFLLGVIEQEQGNFEEAIKYLQEVPKLKPDYSQAYYYLGSSFSKLGKTDEAIAAFERSLELKPLDINSTIELSKILVEVGEKEKASSLVELALKAFPRDLDLLDAKTQIEK